MQSRMFSLSLLVLGLMAACGEPQTVATEQEAPTNFLQETPADRDARMKWWREARFGMFIHWGLYAVPAGEYQGKRTDQVGEWIQSWANIPRAEYERFAEEFNPVEFDAAEWVGLAKNAGMKYIVITSKHHDGFALYDSAVSDYDVVDATPYGRDPIAALAEECKKQGIILCFYHSIMDWHHPSQYVDKEGKDPTAGDGQNRIYGNQKEDYVRYMKTQLRELVTQYDPAVLWFDGEWVDWWTEEDGKDLYNYVRGLKPSIIINNRVGKGRQGMQGLNKGPDYAGDFGTPEQEIPPTGLPGVDWESCMTMNDTWGYKRYDENWKSTETLVRNLIDITSKGGNYLLNVGPTKTGLIPQPSQERLAAIGEWLAANGEAIYGSSASPFESLEWGRATRKDRRIYLQVFDWPSGALTVPALDSRVRRVYPLTNPDLELVYRQGEEIEITLPAEPLDPIATVIVLEFEAPVQAASR